MRFLTQLNLSHTVLISVIIILCVTIFVWQVLEKMTRRNIGKNEEAEIRALIIARGSTGATLEQVKRDYTEQTGKALEHGDDYALRQWMGKIAHVTSKYERGQIVYYSEAPGQQHLTKMIRKQVNNSKTFKNARRRSRMLSEASFHNDTCYATPHAWTNSLIFRRSQLMNVNYQTNHLKMNDSMEHHETPLGNTFIHPPQPQAPKRPMMFAPTDENNNSKRSCFMRTAEKLEPECDQSNSNVSSCTISNVSSLTDRFSELDENIDPFLPEFYKCILVGDNFFLNLAVMDMGFRMLNRDRILQSGFCVSGQTIAEAAKNIESIGANQIILLNVGSIDIVQGKELIDMIYAMFRLMKVCKMNEITPILTTLLPLANYRLGNRAAVTNGFNEFLVKNPFNFPVIELHKTFSNDDGAMSMNFYQQTTRFVSGLSKPVVFWSRMGRQRVMRTLTQELGSAILKILMK